MVGPVIDSVELAIVYDKKVGGTTAALPYVVANELE